MDYSLPGSYDYEISQERIPGWVAISSSRESAQPKDQTSIYCIGKPILYPWATWEAKWNADIHN